MYVEVYVQALEWRGYVCTGTGVEGCVCTGTGVEGCVCMELHFVLQCG